MKSIIMNTQEVQAILDDRKSQFRVPLASKKIKKDSCISWHGETFTSFETGYHSSFTITHEIKIGDILTCKEKRKNNSFEIKVTNIRVERLKDIKLADIYDEGFYPNEPNDCPCNYTDSPCNRCFNYSEAEDIKEQFKEHYKSIPNDAYVFVYEFKRVEKCK